MLDEEMVAGGFARVSTYPPDVKYETRFIQAEEATKAAKRGMWGACDYFGAPLPTSTSVSAPPITSTPDSVSPVATPTGGSQDSSGGAGDLPYDPNGPDRDCTDFATQGEAQRFFIAAGCPARDPHRLDGDHDGIACESLP